MSFASCATGSSARRSRPTRRASPSRSARGPARSRGASPCSTWRRRDGAPRRDPQRRRPGRVAGRRARDVRPPGGRIGTRAPQSPTCGAFRLMEPERPASCSPELGRRAQCESQASRAQQRQRRSGQSSSLGLSSASGLGSSGGTVTFSGSGLALDDRDVDLGFRRPPCGRRGSSSRARATRPRTKSASGSSISAGSRGAAAGRPSPGRSPSRRAAPSPPR